MRPWRSFFDEILFRDSAFGQNFSFNGLFFRGKSFLGDSFCGRCFWGSRRCFWGSFFRSWLSLLLYRLASRGRNFRLGGDLFSLLFQFILLNLLGLHNFAAVCYLLQYRLLRLRISAKCLCLGLLALSNFIGFAFALIFGDSFRFSGLFIEDFDSKLLFTRATSYLLLNRLSVAFLSSFRFW